MNHHDLDLIDNGQREGARKVFDWLIQRSGDPEEVYSGSYAVLLRSKERTQWLEKMRLEYESV